MKTLRFALAGCLSVLASSRGAWATNPCDVSPAACKEWQDHLAAQEKQAAAPTSGDSNIDEVRRSKECDADPAFCDQKALALAEENLKKEAEERRRLGWAIEWTVPESAINQAGYSLSPSRGDDPRDAGLSWRENGSGRSIGAKRTRDLVYRLLNAEIKKRQGAGDADAKETARLQSLSDGLAGGRSIVELTWPSYSKERPDSKDVPLRFRKIAPKE